MKSIEYENFDIKTCDKASLVDLNDIKIEEKQSTGDKIMNFIGQTKNPYLFKVGDIAVKTNFGGEMTFDNALTNLLHLE